MKLSVCIFTFNHAAFIAQAIESVLKQQANFEFEVIIGEDCSTDRTRDIVESFQAKYPDKVRAFLNPKNLGVMPNNVYILGQARGEYIALLDGDDYWLGTEKLQHQVDFLDANPDFVLCFHDAKVLGLNGQIGPQTCCGDKQKKVVSLSDIVCDTHIPTGSVVFRRSALKKFPPPNYCSLKATDRPLFLFLSEFGRSYYFNETWSVYRKHPNGDWTGRPYQSQYLTHLQIYTFMNKHLKRKHESAFCSCETRVAYELAFELLKHGRVKRARYAFRRFLRASKGLTPFNLGVLYKTLKFYNLMFRHWITSTQAVVTRNIASKASV
ncbi:MAG: glycosyltransferase [Chryseotalea sp. WA131a]|nr:MAG: glycosyltransferase [Chryseotalea sp. WA131a]